MKKKYIKPTTKVIILQTESLICQSPAPQVDLYFNLDDIEEDGYAD